MKKVLVVLTILTVLVLLTGCLDYKAYDAAQKEDDTDLVNEIAEIEKELNANEKEAENTKLQDEEEVKVVELDEEDSGVLVLNVNENELVKLKVKVTDPDGDSVSYTFSRPMDDKGEWKTNYGDAGEYMVTIKATDNVHVTEKQVRIVVNRVNVPPVIEKLSDIRVKEAQTIVFEPKVSDPNGDAVTVAISEPLKSGSLLLDHTSSGEYLIKVTASDGELESASEFKLYVADVNVLPVIKNVEDIVVKEGETVEIKPVVTDLDEDQINLEISEPVGSDGIWETGYTDHGEYVIAVTANDGKDKVTKNVKVTVEDVNMPPEITDISLAVN